MTKEQIEDMEEGMEMDALIAEKVMGHVLTRTPHLTVKCYEDYDKTHGGLMNTPWELNRYSTDIACAWLVVEKLQLYVWPLDDKYWCAGLMDGGEYVNEKCIDGYFHPSAKALTAPLAICKTALLTTL